MNTTMPAKVVRNLVQAENRITELEGEVRRLKKLLAARTDDPLARTGQIVKRTGGDDWMAGLAKQDRSYMEKKLGKSK